MRSDIRELTKNRATMPPGQDGIIAFAAHTNKGARLRPWGVGGIEREYRGTGVGPIGDGQSLRRTTGIDK
jgi:hypothetical protein